MQMQFSLFFVCRVSICSFLLLATDCTSSQPLKTTFASGICLRYILRSRVEYIRGVCFFWCSCGLDGTFDSFSKDTNLDTSSSVSCNESSFELSSIFVHNAWMNHEPESLLRNEKWSQNDAWKMRKSEKFGILYVEAESWLVWRLRRRMSIPGSVLWKWYLLYLNHDIFYK